jgi:hypothetical protein
METLGLDPAEGTPWIRLMDVAPQDTPGESPGRIIRGDPLGGRLWGTLGETLGGTPWGGPDLRDSLGFLPRGPPGRDHLDGLPGGEPLEGTPGWNAVEGIARVDPQDGTPGREPLKCTA